MARATSSFPVPVSPVIRTGVGLSATFNQPVDCFNLRALADNSSKNPDSASGSDSSGKPDEKSADLLSVRDGPRRDLSSHVSNRHVFLEQVSAVHDFLTTASGKVCQRDELVLLQNLRKLEAIWLYCKITPWGSVRSTRLGA